LHDSIGALSRYFAGDESVHATLQSVIDLSQAAVSPAAVVAITMLVNEKPQTSVFTDEMAPEVDEAQYSSGRGPCLDAFREGEVKRIKTTDFEDRWPEFAAAAAKHGIKSTLSLPLTIEDRRLGALNFYAREEDAFSEADEELATAFATQASIVLGNATAYFSAQELNEGLRLAMESRATIEQAKGIIMAQSAVDPEEAFDVLRRASQRENRKLRDIAHEMVERAARGLSADG
jgi:GAF domain-containing protein